MRRSRSARAFALLVLIVAQGAFVQPPRLHCHGDAAAQATAGMPVQGGAAHAPMPGMASGPGPEHGAQPRGAPPRPHGPLPSCPSCPGMPGTVPGGSCLDMAGCGPTLLAPAVAFTAGDVAVSTTDVPPARSAPPAHDFIPDPPPPRA